MKKLSSYRTLFNNWLITLSATSRNDVQRTAEETEEEDQLLLPDMKTSYVPNIDTHPPFRSQSPHRRKRDIDGVLNLQTNSRLKIPNLALWLKNNPLSPSSIYYVSFVLLFPFYLRFSFSNLVSFSLSLSLFSIPVLFPCSCIILTAIIHTRHKRQENIPKTTRSFSGESHEGWFRKIGRSSDVLVSCTRSFS